MYILPIIKIINDVEHKLLKLKLFSRSSADNWGVILSAVCALHCLMIPFIALASPILGHYLQNMAVHLLIFIILLPISFVAFVKQKKHHQKITPTILASIGLTFLALGIFLEIDHEHINQGYEIYFEEVLSIIGSFMLISAHLLNIKHLRNCRKCNHH